MSVIAPQRETESSGALTYAAAGASDTSKYRAGLWHIVKNGGASPITVTIASQVSSIDDQQYGEVAKSDFTKSVPAGDFAVIPPLSKDAFVDSSTGNLTLTYSDNTSVTVAAYYN